MTLIMFFIWWIGGFDSVVFASEDGANGWAIAFALAVAIDIGVSATT